MPWTEATTLHRLRWFNQGFRHGKQKRPLYNAAKDWMSSKTIENRQVLPRRHGRYFQRDGSSSIRNGVKQERVLAPALFGIFFSLLLSFAFNRSENGVYLHKTSDGNLFNLAHLRAKTKLLKLLIREMLFCRWRSSESSQWGCFATSHERLCSCLQRAWSHNKSQEDQHLSTRRLQCPSVQIDDYTLEVVQEFVYLGSTISSNLFLDTELDKRIGKAATAMAHRPTGCGTTLCWPRKPRWTFIKPACSPLCRLNTFHTGCLRKIQGITWQDRIPNKDVLAKTRRRLRWLGHVRTKEGQKDTKDTQYGELFTGPRPTGRPIFRLKDLQIWHADRQH